MLDEGNAPNFMDTPDAPPPEEKSNRTFWIVGGVMAGLVFLTLACMALYFLVLAPRITAQRVAAQATIEAGNAQAIQQMTLTAQAAAWTPTLPPTPLRTSTSIPPTKAATPTPVIAPPLSSPEAATATTDPATLVAMQTELAYQLTSTFFVSQGTPGFDDQGMPTTGFFDEIGLPSLIILALALVIVILLARRMRKAPTK